MLSASVLIPIFVCYGVGEGTANQKYTRSNIYMPSATGYSRIPLIEQPQVWTGSGLPNVMDYYTVPVLTDNCLLPPSQNVYLSVISVR